MYNKFSNANTNIISLCSGFQIFYHAVLSTVGYSLEFKASGFAWVNHYRKFRVRFKIG